jgi:hypothetical protein
MAYCTSREQKSCALRPALGDVTGRREQPAKVHPPRSTCHWRCSLEHRECHHGQMSHRHPGTRTKSQEQTRKMQAKRAWQLWFAFQQWERQIVNRPKEPSNCTIRITRTARSDRTHALDWVALGPIFPTSKECWTMGGQILDAWSMLWALLQCHARFQSPGPSRHSLVQPLGYGAIHWAVSRCKRHPQRSPQLMKTRLACVTQGIRVNLFLTTLTLSFKRYSSFRVMSEDKRIGNKELIRLSAPNRVAI